MVKTVTVYQLQVRRLEKEIQFLKEELSMCNTLVSTQHTRIQNLCLKSDTFYTAQLSQLPSSGFPS